MPIRILRIAVVIITVLVTGLFGFVYVKTKYLTDKTIPVISMDSDEIEISVKDGDEAILKGVTASDAKDGDITPRLLVESISKFTEKGCCKASVAVCDDDNHVSTATRRIRYTDYEPPQFTMTRSLVFSIYDKIDLIGIIGAKDCIDGDISTSVLIYSADYAEGEEGTFAMQATVTNSKGDMVDIVFPLRVEKMAKNAPKIKLNKYIMYLDKNPRRIPNWRYLVTETVDSTGIAADLDIEISTDYVPGKKGVFTVDYYGTDSKELTGHTALTVVVR